MFLAFPSSGRWNEAKVEAYFQALCRIPLHFVQQAVDFAVRGKLGDGRAAPSAAELAKLAAELQLQALRRNESHPKVEPTVYNTPEQRQRVIEGYRRLLSDLRSGKPIEPDIASACVYRLRDEDE